MKKRTTFSVAFYARRTRLNKHGESVIMLRISVNRMRADTTIKRTINPDLWDSARGKARERTPLAKELNMFMETIRAKIVRIHREMETDGIEYITAQMVLDKYLGRDKPTRHTLIEVFQKHNEKCKALAGIDMSPATVERYETCLKHTVEFMQHTYKKDMQKLTDTLNEKLSFPTNI